VGRPKTKSQAEGEGGMTTLSKCELCEKEHVEQEFDGTDCLVIPPRCPMARFFVEEHEDVNRMWNHLQAAIRKAKKTAWSDGHRTALQIQAEIQKELRGIK